MNCANHPGIEKVAFCRTCGKPLCANCTREVRGVVYCENCLADHMQGVQPATPAPAGGFVSSSTTPVMSSSGPNPALAGILAGFFPFGVGAVYCGQYAKGLAHLVVFTLLVWGESVVDNAGLNVILAFGIAFFYVYQIIDSVRTARAIQMGQPAPDPLGLAQAFGAETTPPVQPGQPVQPAQTAARIPTAAIVLIGLGVLFLLQTIGVFGFDADRMWPVLLIALGIWLFFKRFCREAGYRYRGLTGPVVLVTIGLLQLIESFDGPRWHRTWPILLLAIGVAKLVESQQPRPPLPPMPGPGGASHTGSGPVQPPSSEVRNG